VKIADFGIAKMTRELTRASLRTSPGVALRTPGYMSPEQVRADGLGPWSDLYSLGCVAYELCVGSVPFAGCDDSMALMLRHITDPIPSAHAVDPTIDPALSSWIDSLLVKDPGKRVRTAAAAWDALEEILLERLGPAGAAAPNCDPRRPRRR
jgi:serine/threonine protein kinase